MQEFRINVSQELVHCNLKDIEGEGDACKSVGNKGDSNSRGGMGPIDYDCVILNAQRAPIKLPQSDL